MILSTLSEPTSTSSAFSTVSLSNLGFRDDRCWAQEYGYDGVEVRGFLNETLLTASNVFLTDPKKVSAMFKYHGIEICLFVWPVPSR